MSGFTPIRTSLRTPMKWACVLCLMTVTQTAHASVSPSAIDQLAGAPAAPAPATPLSSATPVPPLPTVITPSGPVAPPVQSGGVAAQPNEIVVITPTPVVVVSRGVLLQRPRARQVVAFHAPSPAYGGIVLHGGTTISGSRGGASSGHAHR